MITIEELNPHKLIVTPEIESNLNELLIRMNKIRALWGKPMIVTSGLRSKELQSELIKVGKSTAYASRHLTGQACDIFDPHKDLANWCLLNAHFLGENNLWCEDPSYCSNWTHFQSVPPKSGKRFFIP
jgi:hypothetical protein